MRDIIKSDQTQDEVKIINGEEVVVSRKKRRRNMSLYYVLIVIFVVLAMIFLSFTVLFNIKTIEVNGNSLYTNEQVIEMSGVKLGDNLFRTDTNAAEHMIMSAFPYFENVTVRRKLASKLIITVKEAVPAASINYDTNKFLAISKNGRILETDLAAPREDTAEVFGMELSKTDVGQNYEDKDSMKQNILNEILQECDKLGLNKLTKIDISTRTDIRLIYNGCIKIKLGSSQDIPFKLSYIKSVIDSVGENYAGTLIYHSAESGISAIPDETQPATEAVKSDNPDSDENTEPTTEEDWSAYVR